MKVKEKAALVALNNGCMLTLRHSGMQA